MSFSDWMHVAAVVAAVGASVIALLISFLDRRAMKSIAREDRTLARLTTELEYAVRLSANRNMGGSTDKAESKRLGAEALALAVVVGERWVPRQYAHATEGKSRDELEAMVGKPDGEIQDWVKDKIESALAVQSIIDELYRR